MWQLTAVLDILGPQNRARGGNWACLRPPLVVADVHEETYSWLTLRSIFAFRH